MKHQPRNLRMMVLDLDTLRNNQNDPTMMAECDRKRKVENTIRKYKSDKTEITNRKIPIGKYEPENTNLEIQIRNT